jgi:hypothetical protein
MKSKSATDSKKQPIVVRDLKTKKNPQGGGGEVALGGPDTTERLRFSMPKVKIAGGSGPK